MAIRILRLRVTGIDLYDIGQRGTDCHDQCAHWSRNDKWGRLAADTPLGRIGTPEEVAAAILYLAEADFVTGQNLPVNGGYL